MKTHKVVDLIVEDQEGGRVCFVGTQEECRSFVKEQKDSHFSYQILPLQQTEIKYYNESPEKPDVPKKIKACKEFDVPLFSEKSLLHFDLSKLNEDNHTGFGVFLCVVIGAADNCGKRKSHNSIECENCVFNYKFATEQLIKILKNNE